MQLSEFQLFDRFFNGGTFTLPLLIKFSCLELEPICLVNDNVNIEFNNEVYKSSTFEYSPPDMTGKSASLKISGIGNDLISFVENSNENFRLDVVGVIAENGEIQKLKQYHHFYGSVSYNEKMEIDFKLSGDDRLNMTFPPYKFDTETNKGNA